MLPAGCELVIWDFDGTILDTEWPAFAAAKVEFENYGCEIDEVAWQHTLGSADHEPWWETLRRQVGEFREPDDELIERWRAAKHEMIAASDLRPGVQARFDAFQAEGVPCVLASSSPLWWVEPHLKQRGLWDRLTGVTTSDDVGAGRTKPHPDLFLLAAERAGIDPSKCMVIEDSPHGVTAAKAAGMYVVVAPHRLTESLDLSAADRVVQSLADF